MVYSPPHQTSSCLLPKDFPKVTTFQNHNGKDVKSLSSFRLFYGKEN